MKKWFINKWAIFTCSMCDYCLTSRKSKNFLCLKTRKPKKMGIKLWGTAAFYTCVSRNKDNRCSHFILGPLGKLFIASISLILLGAFFGGLSILLK